MSSFAISSADVYSKSTALWMAAIKRSTSSALLYTPKEIRTVPFTPKASIKDEHNDAPHERQFLVDRVRWRGLDDVRHPSLSSVHWR